ncbi:MAG: putative phosphoribosyl transferase [bacterium ADurb.Bin400]|nr:MAG: putative phosphoribosyl transferase [bacterium ADurb.Bin400]
MTENGTQQESVMIPLDEVMLEGILATPEKTRGMVIFAHGSGSSRFSPRNAYVAKVLRSYGLGTFLFDLLTEEENKDYENRCNIDLLAFRLKAATSWVMGQPGLGEVGIGYFGASTGAAAALEAAADFGEKIGAVVLRGGRPDLAISVVGRIVSPTLFIVGGNDEVVIELNQRAYNMLHSEKKLVVIPGATRLFEEPGKLEEVAQTAKDWFVRYLKKEKGWVV